MKRLLIWAGIYLGAVLGLALLAAAADGPRSLGHFAGATVYNIWIVGLLSGFVGLPLIGVTLLGIEAVKACRRRKVT